MCGLSPLTSLDCSAELKPRAGVVCCLLQSSGIALTLLFSQHCASQQSRLCPSAFMWCSAVMPDPAACNHLLQFYLPMYFYGITLCPTPPVCPHPSWPAALEHTAASSLPLSVMKKVYSLKKAQTHMLQHLICFKSHKSQVENPPLHICLGVRVWISPEKTLLSAFEGSSFAFDVAISEELALSHCVFPSQIETVGHYLQFI